MSLSSSIKVCFVLALVAFSLSGCERDEPAELLEATFRINVTENFINFRHNSVLIISDFSGNVLTIDHLNYKGMHELMVTQTADDRFHLTIFDGYSVFKTFTFLPEGEYVIDMAEPHYYSDEGRHTVRANEPFIQPSGIGILYGYLKAPGEAEVYLTAPTSDLYVYFENLPTQFGYYYLPEIRANESTTLQEVAAPKAFNKLPVTLQSLQGTNIWLYGDNDADEAQMRYLLSRSGPLPPGPGMMNVPAEGEPSVKFYRTVFSGADGHMYTHTGENIERVQKRLITSVQRIETNAASVFYSITSDASVIEWSASGINFHWTVFSQPGENIKINLPKLPLSFRNGYDLNMMETLEFANARLTKDSRFSNYFDLVRRYHFQDEHPAVTPYFQIQQAMSVQ
ncbi:MAG TPA: hypothetical protein VGD31_04560 [Sphingobacteriaceae bacterium]